MKQQQLPKTKGIKIVTPTFRVSFPALDKPRAYQDKGEPKYSIAMLFEKDDVKPIQKAILQAMAEKFGRDTKKWPKYKNPLKSGDDKSDLIGYAGKVILNAKSKDRPLVVDLDRSVLPSADKIYPGSYAKAVVVIKAVSNGSEWFVTAYLHAVQFVKNGERLGGVVNLENDFEDLSSSEIGEDDFGFSDNQNDEYDDLNFN
jgi:hypothetical protein